MDDSSIVDPSLVCLDLDAPDRDTALRRTAELLAAATPGEFAGLLGAWIE